MKKGRLYGLSLGPGEPGLITRQVWGMLQGGGRWAYPIRKRGAESYALSIVERAGLALPEDAMALVFPMIQDGEKLARAWAEAALEVVEVLKAGRDL